MSFALQVPNAGPPQTRARPPDQNARPARGAVRWTVLHIRQAGVKDVRIPGEEAARGAGRVQPKAENGPASAGAGACPAARMTARAVHALCTRRVRVVQGDSGG